MGSFTIHVSISSILLKYVIWEMPDSIDDFHEEQSMQLFDWLNCKV